MNTSLKGGAKNRAPIPGTELPNIKTVEDFKSKMDFYTVIGHGTIASRNEDEGTVFLVPPKTYIFFITRAGIPAEKIKTGALKDELDKLYYKRVNEKGTEIESDDVWSQRIYASMKDSTLLKSVLYNETKPFVEDKGFAIYEPGDLIQNLSISFYNNTFPYMMLGIWKLPIDREKKEYLDSKNKGLVSFNEDIQEYITQLEQLANKIENPADKETVLKVIIPFLLTMGKVTAEEEKKFVENPKVINIFINYPTISNVRKQIYQMYKTLSELGNVEETFINDRENLINEYRYIRQSRMSTLYNILHETKLGSPILSDTNYRFIVVDACRSLTNESPLEHTLRRTASSYMRPEICYPSLLSLTKKGFESLVGKEKLENTSVVNKLLQGEQIKLSEFEQQLAPVKMLKGSKPYTLPDLLEYHKFKEGNVGYFFPKASQYFGKADAFQRESIKGIVKGATIGKDGSIRFLFQNDDIGTVLPLPALNIWPSEEVYIASLSKEERNIKKLRELVEEDEEKEARRIQKEKEEEERQKKEAAAQQLAYEKFEEARKAEQKKIEDENRKTFEDLKEMIAKSDKQNLLSYGKKVVIKLSPEPAKGSVFTRWQNREGIIRKVIKSTKDGKDYLSVFIDPIRYGGEDPLDSRAFRTEFIFEPPKPVKKGGRRKTKHNRKSKKRTTRRL